jgi:hypothetical protein
LWCRHNPDFEKGELLLSQNRIPLLLIYCVALALGACDSPGSDDAEDSGSQPVVDAGQVGTDAGTATDSGAAVDAGSPPPADAGLSTDAGGQKADASLAPDAGASADAGCGPTEYCHTDTAYQCDGPGTCATLPENCLSVYDPVCGCDGQTYSNGCEANAVGINVASEGECGGAGDN